MRDGPGGEKRERGLASRVRRELYEPALRDLEVERLIARERARGAADRFRIESFHRFRRLFLYIDCWRVALPVAMRSMSRPQAGDGPAARVSGAWSSGSNPTVRHMRRRSMFGYHMRHAFTRLLREPAFTMAAVLTLALGVGANVAVFAVVEAVLLRPLPYEGADRLVILNHRDQRTGITKEFIAIGDYVDLAQRQRAFEAMAGYGTFTSTIYGEGEPVRVSGLQASPELFDLMKLRAAAGRSFEAADADEGAAPVMILGYALWRDRYASDPAVVGRGIRVGQQVRTVVGIAPPGFRFPPDADMDVILPMPVPLEAPASRKSAWIFAVARLAAGQTVASATSELASISQQMEREHPEQNQGSTYYVETLRDSLVGSTRQALMLMLAAVGLVLLIACANVANLQLARSLARRREMAVRLALGAGRARLVSLLLAENLALALVASAVGVAFAHWGVRALVALIPRSVSVPGLQTARLNGLVLAFALAIALLSAVAFGLMTAFTVRLEHAGDVLVSAGRATMTRLARRATSGLVIVEVALAVMLLLGAGLVLRSFAALVAVDPGFDYHDVMTVTVQIPADRYEAEEARRAFWSRAFDAVRAVPGVESAGVAVVVPLTGNNWTVAFERADRPVASGERPPDVGWQTASGGWFRALRIPLVAGRLFDDRDAPGSDPVVIISEAIARQYFANEEAVGRRVRLGSTTAEIVGVVGNIRRASLDDRPRTDMYFPFESGPGNQMTLFVRTSSDPIAFAGAIRDAIRSVERDAVFQAEQSLAGIASESMHLTRLVLWLLGVFALCALALAAIGIYGVMSCVVRQRTREIGTRIAVGATRADILWLVLKQGAIVAAAGIGSGVLIGLIAARTLRSVLYGVSSSDPLTLILACAVLAVTTLFACWAPARCASSVDPARTLAQS